MRSFFLDLNLLFKYELKFIKLFANGNEKKRIPLCHQWLLSLIAFYSGKDWSDIHESEAHPAI